MSEVADCVLNDLVQMAREDKHTLEFLVEQWMTTWTDDQIRQQYIDLWWGTEDYDIGEEY